MKKTISVLVILLSLNGLSLFAQSHLLPAPQKIKWGNDKFQLSNVKVLVSPDLFQREQKTITQFLSYIKKNTGLSVTTTYIKETTARLIILNSKQAGLRLAGTKEQTGLRSREAYHISVNADEVKVNANTDAGLFYALQTLRQLIITNGINSYIPEVNIEDYPAIAYRGVMVDFSHGGLPTEDEIKSQIDFLARWKINQYYFYNEVSIEMKGYPLINYNACYSQKEIKRIISYARERHIDVIPFVNFYGHLHELLRLEKYSSLAIGNYGHELNPENPEVQTLLKNWIKQYVDLFPSSFVHIGFDETWETERLTAQNPSINPGELYLKQLNFVARTFQHYGKTVMLWTDITKNYPDIISEFPKGLIPVIWEYSDKADRIPRWLKPVKKEKMPFFIQSAVDSWGNVYPAADYSYDNIDNCLNMCRDEKSMGYITSVWTDAVQPLLRNSWIFMAYGSIGAWQKEPVNRDAFIDTYSQIMYHGISTQMSIGFKKMAESEFYLAKCLGRHTLNKMFTNPFTMYMLENTNLHLKDFKKARIAAESALENFIEALRYQTADSSFIKSMLVNSRMSHYTATRFIWAKRIVDRWNWKHSLNTADKKDHYRFYDINYSAHGLTVDMMDWCTEIKKEYVQSWQSEYKPYRMGTISGRFDAEYFLWRKLYREINDFRYFGDSSTNLKFENLFIKE
jgi:hypothetical protein